MAAQERFLMNQLVQDRLNELNGRKKERQSISTGADGLGEEREIVHQINRVGRAGTMPVVPMPRGRRSTASTASYGGDRPIVSTPSRASTSPRSTARKAVEAVPMDTTSPPSRRVLTARRRPMAALAMDTAQPAQRAPPRAFSAQFKGLAKARPLKMWATKTKKIRNNPFLGKSLKGKHMRTWKESLPLAKRLQTKFPNLDAGVVAGESDPRKRRLTEEDWEEAEEDARDILPPSKRMPRAM